MCRKNPVFLMTFIVFLTLNPAASAGTVTRTIVMEDNIMANYTYKTATITLTPAPLDDFKLPGYVVEEYLPNGAALVETSADWYRYREDGSKLSMLRFNPTQDTAQITYKLKFPIDGGTYILTGKFMDRGRAQGDIAPQEIIVNKGGYSGAFVSGSSTAGSYWGKQEEIKATENIQPSSTPIIITAAQKLPDESNSMDGTYFWRTIVAMIVIIGAILVKRNWKKITNKIIVTEYVFVEEHPQEKSK